MAVDEIALPETISQAYNKINELVREINTTNAAQDQSIDDSTQESFFGSGAPGVNDDSADTSGNGAFEINSLWVDTNASPKEGYRCADATPTAAVWLNTTLEVGDLGALAVKDGVNNSDWSGTDLAVLNGGTGSSDAGSARTALGLAIGTDVQAHDAVLDATTASFLIADGTKLDGIEAAATADQTGAEIKALYEVEANAFTNAQFTKLSGIEALADVTDALNVDAAGALMESEVDADLKTLSLPASTTISIFGASLVDDADAAAAKVTMGVVIGTDVQAWSSVLDATTASFLIADETKLDALLPVTQTSGTQDANALTTPGIYISDASAALTNGGNAVFGWTLEVMDVGSGRRMQRFTSVQGAGAATQAFVRGWDGTTFTAWQEYTNALINIVEDTTPQLGGNLDTQSFTVDGRDVSTDGTKLDGIEALADVTDATNVAAAGAGMLNIAQEWTKQQNFNATTLIDGANIAWNLDDNQVTGVIIAGNRTIDNPTNMVDGATYILRVTQDAVGSRTLTWGAAFIWPDDLPPVLTTTANKTDVIAFISDGTNMFGETNAKFNDWQSYTPVISSTTGGWTNVTLTGFFRVINKMLEVSFKVSFSGATATVSAMFISLPSGLTINTAVLAGGGGWDTDTVGQAIFGDAGTASGIPAIINTRTSTKVLVKYQNDAGSHIRTLPPTQAAPFVWANTDSITGRFTVPIV